MPYQSEIDARKLLNAAKKGDIEEIRRLSAERNFRVNENAHGERKAINQAIMYEQEEAVELLLSLGANTEGAYYGTPSLVFASITGNVKITNLLIENAKSSSKDANELITKLNYQDRGKVLVAVATEHGNTEIADIIKQEILALIPPFLKEGNHLEERRGFNILDLAAISGNMELVERIFTEVEEHYKESPEKFLELYENTSNLAKECGNLEASEFLHDRISKIKRKYERSTDLWHAVNKGAVKKAKAIIADAGGEIDFELLIGDSYGRVKTSGLIEAAKSGHEELVDILLEAGADPDFRNFGSAIDHAVHENHPKIVDKLIAALKEKYKDDPRNLLLALDHSGIRSKSALNHANDQKNTSLSTLLTEEIEATKKLFELPKIVIVGGGFSGTMTAVNLLKRAEKPLEIIIVEKKPEQQDSGLAYSKSTAAGEHLINIQSSRMSAIPGESGDFESWLSSGNRRRYRDTDAVPRRVYGQYLSQRLDSAITGAKPYIELTRVSGNCVDIDAHENGNGATVKLEDGQEIEAVQVVLASGHNVPVEPDFISDVKENERFVASQWSPGGQEKIAKSENDEPVLVIGTSMSAFDAVISLRKKGHTGEIVLLSRHGYTHETYPPNYSHRQIDITGYNAPRGIEDGKDYKPSFMNAENKEELIAGIRKEFFRLKKHYSGEQILEFWEQFAPELAENLRAKGIDVGELLRDHMSLINTLRIGVSHTIGNQVNDARADGQVKIWSGNIQGMSPTDDGIEVSYTLNTDDGVSERRTRKFGMVISGLGQETNYAKVAEHDPLWKLLLGGGIATEHYTGMGIDVGEKGELIDIDGNKSEIISAVGIPRIGDTMVRKKTFPDIAYNDRNSRETPIKSGSRLGPPASSVIAIKGQALEVALDVLVRLEQVLERRKGPNVSPEAHARTTRKEHPRIKGSSDQERGVYF